MSTQFRAAIRAAVFIFAASVAQNASAVDLESTKAAEHLINTTLYFPPSRETLAQVVFNYCKETSNNVPHNSQKEDQELTAALTSGDANRVRAVTDTIEMMRWHFQKMFTDCIELSKAILDRPNNSATEGVFWVKLEAAFDLPSRDYIATRIGILRKNENGQTLSDLHAITWWPMVRAAIRHAVLLLLSAQPG